MLFSLMLGLSANAAGPACSALFDQRPTAQPRVIEKALLEELHAQDKAILRVDLQHFYERAIYFLQKKVTVKSVRSTTALQQSRKLELINFLNEGKRDEAVDLFRKQFDDVELAFFMIKSDEATLKNPELEPVTTLRIEKRHLLNQRKFAHNYGEYLSIRNFLEGIITSRNQSPAFRKTAEDTLRILGVHKFSEKYADFAALKIPEERPSVKDIQNLFRSSSRYTRLKLMKDFRNEIVSVLKYFLSSEVLVQSVDNLLSRFPPHLSDKLKSLTGLMRSAQLRNRQLPLIVEIESMPKNPKLRLEELRSKNSITKNDELLVTYVRTVDFTDSWIALKAAAVKRAEEPGNTIHKNFYERMLQAEVRAAKLTDISLSERISNVDVLMTVVHCGILIRIFGPENLNSFSDLVNLISSVPFFP